MKLSQTGAVTTVSIDLNADGSEHWFLNQADLHHDHPTCNRELEYEHLQEAVNRQAKVLMYGDIFDAMQGKFDPRRSYDELRPEYKVPKYYDALVNDFSKWYSEFSSSIIMMADGNHELAVEKAANTNLIDRLVDRLNMGGAEIVHGGYGGWVRFMFHRDGVPQNSIRLKFYHGSGGEAPVTRGAIQTARQGLFLPDADIVVNGHSHNSYHIPIARERLSAKGRHYFDVQHHIRIPGYKQDYGDGAQGWTVTRGGVPKPIGACWIKLKFINSVHAPSSINITIQPDVRGPDVVTIGGDPYDGPEYDQDPDGL